MVQSNILALLLAATASFFPLQIAAATIPKANDAPALVAREWKLSKGGLDRRDTPDACKFPLGRLNDFYYWDQSDVTGHATCVGWAKPIACDAWSQQDISDGMSAMSQQLKKDGHLEGTTVGRWTATFDLTTSAFEYTDPVNFDHVFETSQTSDQKTMHGATSWYYMDQGDFIDMETTHC